jgi:NAD(P)H-dependent FMN reductase
MPLIKIIVGSIRPNRFGPQPAKWLFDLAQARTDARFELVDLEELRLPFLDEPKTASSGVYENAHTKKWSAAVGEADGFVFVTPEYNHSYSPAIKNALDYLYYEWNYKAAAFLSYGGAAGGLRATEHLRGVAAELKLFQIRETVSLYYYWNNLDEKGAFKFTEENRAAAKAMLNELVFWSEHLKSPRAELAALKKQEES